jgi:hypothetical protein
MSYGQQDIFKRIKLLLPARWFGEDTPILDAVINSLSAGWAGLFDLIAYVKTQARISTAMEAWLDLVARDFFGDRVIRRQRETDASFRKRISMELLRDKCTRAALYDLLKDLTGMPPAIFEPSNPRDTGCYGSLALCGAGVAGYGVSGGWGNLHMPFQALVSAFRANVPGVGMINGWDGNVGGFGTGLSAYIDLDNSSSAPDDLEIYRQVSRTCAAGTIIWLSIRP